MTKRPSYGCWRDEEITPRFVAALASLNVAYHASRNPIPDGFYRSAAVVLSSVLFFGLTSQAQSENPASTEQWRALAAQNVRLQEQIARQQQQIETLSARMAEIVKANEQRDQALRTLEGREGNKGNEVSAPPRSEHEIRLSAEAGLGFFRTGSAGQFPNSEFRVDDAKVFLEAPVWKDTYFFAGIELVTREASDEFFHVGELYVDFENVSAHWNVDRLVNVRVGRFNLPFGEEYQVRNVMDNPLISHSVSDVWGIDEGVEIYGESGKFQYAIAVQNGGHKTLRDYDSDKAWIARVSYDPNAWLHLSASGLRTGTLTVAGDGTSEVWLANGFFRALGGAATTQTFRADIFEGDAIAKWRSGTLKGAWGVAHFDDDDRTADNSRQLHYYYVEATQKMGGGFYAAARFSRVRAPRGYPLVGQGDFGRYFFRSPLTEQLHRASIGLGYQIAPPLVWKVEYNQERGRLITGERRDQEDFFSSEIALRF